MAFSLCGNMFLFYTSHYGIYSPHSYFITICVLSTIHRNFFGDHKRKKITWIKNGGDVWQGKSLVYFVRTLTLFNPESSYLQHYTLIGKVARRRVVGAVSFTVSYFNRNICVRL